MRSKVLIVGGGMMGCGIAACSLLAGNPTVVSDTDPSCLDTVSQRVWACLEELVEGDLLAHEDAKRAMKRLETTENLAGVCDQVYLAIEAVVEDLLVKQRVFQELDHLLPAEVLLASNTSGLRITDIGALTRIPARTVTAHFWFPAHLVPLVEVVVGDNTDPARAQQLKDTLTGWGKSAVLVRRDLPGQLANRILQAVIREAVHIVDIGLASAEDVDTAVKAGMGIRMPVWGPLEHMEAVGLDLGLQVQRSVLPEISRETKPSPYLESLVQNGRLGYKSGEGFYDWSRKDMLALAKRRNAFIIAARKWIHQTETDT